MFSQFLANLASRMPSLSTTTAALEKAFFALFQPKHAAVQLANVAKDALAAAHSVPGATDESKGHMVMAAIETAAPELFQEAESVADTGALGPQAMAASKVIETLMPLLLAGSQPMTAVATVTESVSTPPPPADAPAKLAGTTSA